MYMAPEILCKTLRLKSASFTDLKKIDMWAFGMVLFLLINPDLTHPYELDIDGDETTIGIDEVQDLLIKGKRPTGSSKYSGMQSTNWLFIREAFLACTNFDPSERQSAEYIKQTYCAMEKIVDQSYNETDNIRYGILHI